MAFVMKTLLSVKQNTVKHHDLFWENCARKDCLPKAHTVTEQLKQNLR